MTPTTKDTRRANWKSLNFAGSIDWAVDLQSFTADDMATSPDRPSSGEQGCRKGEDDGVDSGDLCQASCALGFCPESLCTCTVFGTLRPLPAEKPGVDMVAWDEFNVDLNRLCKFACKYGYCPGEICTTPPPPETEEDPVPEGDIYASMYKSSPIFPISREFSAQKTDFMIKIPETILRLLFVCRNSAKFAVVDNARWANQMICQIYKDPKYRDVGPRQCKNTCQQQLDDAAKEGRTSNYGCMGFFPLDQPVPWVKPPGIQDWTAGGRCLCDNYLLNELADTVMEALPVIAQVGFPMCSSNLKGAAVLTMPDWMLYPYVVLEAGT